MEELLCMDFTKKNTTGNWLFLSDSFYTIAEFICIHELSKLDMANTNKKTRPSFLKIIKNKFKNNFKKQINPNHLFLRWLSLRGFIVDNLIVKRDENKIIDNQYLYDISESVNKQSIPEMQVLANIKTLFLSSFNFSDTRIINLVSKCKSLEKINITDSDITDESIYHICINCPNISIISLRTCSQITDQSLFNISDAYCSQLTNIDLCYCKKITDIGISYFFKKCEKLETINIGWCRNINDGCLISNENKFSELKCINLKACNKLTDSSIIFISEKCSNLQSIILTGCNLITDTCINSIIEKCPKIEYIDVYKCDLLSDECINSNFRISNRMFGSLENNFDKYTECME